MRKNLKYIPAALFLIVNYQSFSQSDKHVLLISIDGLRSEFYLHDQWDTPNLKALVQSGVYSEGINSVFPSVTYPSHTTIITGAYPASHNIFYNVPREANDNNHWYWDYDQIKTKTLWKAAQEKGLETGAIMWPVTVGAPITYNFPVRRPNKGEKGNQLSVTEPYVTPKNLMLRFRENEIITSKEQFQHDSIDVTIGSMARYVLKNFKPSLMAVHFINVDHTQHVHGRDNSFVMAAIQNIDQQIGKLIETLKQAGIYAKTNIIITGDHGHVDVDKIFLPNLPLRKAGLIDDNSWKAKFNTVGGASFLYVKKKKYINQVNEILNSLPEEERKLFTIFNKKELKRIGADPKAVLAISMKKGYVTNAKLRGNSIEDRKPGAAHGFYPDFKEIQTGFIINGPDVAPHKKIEGTMGIQDIAPIINRILDLGFKTNNGNLHKGILNLK